MPYYDVHKLLAGLLDRYALLQDARSLRMAAALADYFLARIRNVIRLNGTATLQVRKRPSAPLFIHSTPVDSIYMIILPRQARDKHIGNTHVKRVFSLQRILCVEWGGMNEAAYSLFAITHNASHRCRNVFFVEPFYPQNRAFAKTGSG